MNITIKTVITIISFVGFLYAIDTDIVVPKFSSVPVYRNMPRLLNEKPAFEVTASNHLKILDKNDCCYLITDSQGRKGWVEKNKCSRALNGRTFRFETINVEGFNNFFNPHAILDATDPDLGDFYLSRSFMENLRENADREEFFRIGRMLAE